MTDDARLTRSLPVFAAMAFAIAMSPQPAQPTSPGRPIPLRVEVASNVFFAHVTVNGVGQQGKRVGEDAVDRLANDEGAVQGDADRERAAEVCRRVAVAVGAVDAMMVVMVRHETLRPGLRLSAAAL